MTALTIGVLALQGAFHEHVTHLNRIASAATWSSSSSTSPPLNIHAQLVRTPDELARCHALIIPGGESTAIALGAQRVGLMEPLRAWVASGKPTWGTCAGMIMLANQAIGTKRGGQSLIGGVDIRVGRNGFGSQVDSFEAHLDVPALGPEPFPGVFIRAPVIDALLLLPEDHKQAGSSASLPGVNGAAVPVPTSATDLPPDALSSSLSESATATPNGASSTLTRPSLALVQNGNAGPSSSATLVRPTIVYAEPPSTPLFEASEAQAQASAQSQTQAHEEEERKKAKHATAHKLTPRPPIEILAALPFSPTRPPPKETVGVPQSSASPFASDGEVQRVGSLDAAGAGVGVQTTSSSASTSTSTSTSILSPASADSQSQPTQPTPPPPFASATTLLNPERRPAASQGDSPIVALRQGHVLVTSFHPELTLDSRFHEYFVREIVGPAVGGVVPARSKAGAEA